MLVGVEAESSSLLQLLLPPQWEETVISRQQRTAKTVHHNSTQPDALEALNQSAAAGSYPVHHWQLGLTTRLWPQGHTCFPSSLPIFFPEPSGHLRWISQTQQLNPLLVVSFCKVLGTCMLETSQYISAQHPTLSLHSHPEIQTIRLQTNTWNASTSRQRDVQIYISTLTK